MALVRVFTFITEPEHIDMGLPIDPESIERVEVLFNSDFVTYIEAKAESIGGCEINLAGGEFIYVEETPQEVAELIEKAKKNEFYPRSN